MLRLRRAGHAIRRKVFGFGFCFVLLNLLLLLIFVSGFQRNSLQFEARRGELLS